MVVDVYLAPASAPCRAVLMTAKHLGIPVNQKIVDLRGGEQLKPEFVKMNPQHAVPTIDDNGFCLGESRAIQTYLANKYAPDSSLYPKDPQKRALVDRMLYFEMGTLYKAGGEYYYPVLFFGQPADPEKLETFKKALKILEQLLENKTYATGDEITLADLSLLAGLGFFGILGDFSYDEYPNTSALLKRLENELPYHKEINEEPLLAFKEILQKK